MQQQVVDIFKAYDTQGTNTWDFKIASHDLQYQVGNLTKGILQLTGDRYADGLGDDQIKTNIADELADIMAEVLFIAHELDINLTEAWRAMIKSDETKINERS